MNVGKSVKVAIALNGKSINWLAEQLNVGRVRASVIANSERANQETIEKLASVFNLKASEFIALGE